ncbi:hypothetical protein ACFL1G_05305 [Planctomycetota bacterium]
MKRWKLKISLLLCVCGFAIAQGGDGHEELAVQISKSVERATLEFIQIPGPNPILTPSKSGWDSGVTEAADIIKDHHKYYFYYHGTGGGGYQLGVAVADHPLGPWKKYEGNPILELGASGSWEDQHVACAYIVKEKADKFYMWYSAKGSGRDEELGRNVWDIGLATASSPVGPWKKYEKNPIMKDFGYVGGVVKHPENKKYYLYTAHVIGSVGPDYSPMALAIADKPEGPYVEYEGNPILKEGAWGTWDDGGFSEGEVYYQDGAFHMFYGGTKLHPTRILSQESIGYAYSFDGIHFTKHPKNPIAIREMHPDGEAFSEVHAYQEGPLTYLYHTLRYKGLTGVEHLGVQVVATQRPFKVRMPILIKDSVGPGKTTAIGDCKPLALDSITNMTLTFEAKYGAKAGPLTVHVKSSYDGLNYDTIDKDTFVVPALAGQEVRQTFEVSPNVKYIKVEVENPKNSDTIKDVSVYATLGG